MSRTASSLRYYFRNSSQENKPAEVAAQPPKRQRRQETKARPKPQYNRLHCGWAALCIAALFAVASPAGAARVVYVPLARLGESRLADPLDAAILAALKEQPGLVVVIPPVRLENGTGAEIPVGEPAALILARQDLSSGQLPPAIALLQKARQSLERHPEVAPATALAEVSLLLSVAEFRRGNEDAGQRALDEFVRLRPSAELTAPDYPPLFLRLHEEAKKRWREKAAAALRVETDLPASAVIAIDGISVGRAPVVVEHVPPGSHLVTADADGKQWLRQLEVRGDSQPFVFISESFVHSPLQQNVLSRGQKSELAAIAKSVGAAFAVAGVIGDGGSLGVVIVNRKGRGQSVFSTAVDDNPSAWSGVLHELATRVVSATQSTVADSEVNPIVQGTAAPTPAHVDLFSPTVPGPAPLAAETVPAPAKPVSEKTAPQAPVAKHVSPPPPLAQASSAPVVLREAPLRVKPAMSVPPQQPATQEVRRPLYQEWWLWTIVGAAVTGGVVAIVAASSVKVTQVGVNATW